MTNSIKLLLTCIATAVIAQEYQCPPAEVIFYPHPDCTKYIICDNGQAVEMSCPPELYYNPEIKQCDFQDSVPECVGGTRPPEGSTTVQTTIPTVPTTESSTSAQISSTTETPNPEVLWNHRSMIVLVTQCGDTLQANAGRIEYKVGHPYEANELCSFVIRVPNHSGIVFTLHSHGINATTDPHAISIFTFSHLGELGSAYLGPPNPLTEAYVVGAIAVVVFKTNSSLGTGFQLSYQGIGVSANSRGSEHVLCTPSGEFILPIRINYSHIPNNVVVLTSNPKLVDGSSQVLKMTVSEDDFYVCGEVQECACGDSLQVFSFWDMVANHEGVFCSERYDKTEYQSRGILILIYRKWSTLLHGSAKLSWNVTNA